MNFGASLLMKCVPFQTLICGHAHTRLAADGGRGNFVDADPADIQIAESPAIHCTDQGISLDLENYFSSGDAIEVPCVFLSS